MLIFFTYPISIFQDLDDARLYWKMEHTEEPPIPVRYAMYERWYIDTRNAYKVTLGGKSIIVGFNFVKVE